MSKIFPTTAKHFKIFCQEAKYWIERYGLLGWEIKLSHKDIKSFGQCEWEYFNRWAEISLCKEWDEEFTEEEVRRTAYHEVCELLLGPLRSAANMREWSWDNIDREVHVVIRTLENAHFMREKRPK